MRKTGTPNRETPARRRAILTAALAVFEASGYEQATLNRIGARLGVTKGSLYHHFASKEAIAKALFEDALAGMEATLQDAIGDLDDPQELVESVVRAYLEWFEENPGLGSFITRIGAGHIAGASVSQLHRANEEMLAPAAQRLERFARRALVRTMPRPLRMALVLGPPRAFLHHWLTKRDAAEMRAAKRTLPNAVWRSLARD